MRMTACLLAVPLLTAAVLAAVPARAQTPVAPDTSPPAVVAPPLSPSSPALTPPALTTPAPTPPPPTPVPLQHPKKAKATRMTPQQRFDAADVNHTGQITADQARAGGLKSVARHFAEIDTAGRGYVTMDEIRAYQRTRHGARAARGPTGATPPAPLPPAAPQ